MTRDQNKILDTFKETGYLLLMKISGEFSGG